MVFENKNYAMSYIVLAESIVSRVCEKESIGLETADYRSLSDKYGIPNIVRNNIAHQLSDRSCSTISDIENLQKRIDGVEKAFNALDRAD